MHPIAETSFIEDGFQNLTKIGDSYSRTLQHNALYLFAFDKSFIGSVFDVPFEARNLIVNEFGMLPKHLKIVLTIKGRYPAAAVVAA